MKKQKQSEEEKLLLELRETLTMFLMAATLFVITVLVKGFVLLKIWQWLIDPLFEITDINFIQAVAIAFVTGYFSFKVTIEKADEDVSEMKVLRQVLNNLKALLFSSFFILFVSWVISLFI